MAKYSYYDENDRRRWLYIFEDGKIWRNYHHYHTMLYVSMVRRHYLGYYCIFIGLFIFSLHHFEKRFMSRIQVRWYYVVGYERRQAMSDWFIWAHLTDIMSTCVNRPPIVPYVSGYDFITLFDHPSWCIMVMFSVPTLLSWNLIGMPWARFLPKPWCLTQNEIVTYIVCIWIHVTFMHGYYNYARHIFTSFYTQFVGMLWKDIRMTSVVSWSWWVFNSINQRIA